MLPASLFHRRERHFNPFGCGLGPHRLGREQMQVEALGVHLLPVIDQAAVSALHQAVEHFACSPACHGSFNRTAVIRLKSSQWGLRHLKHRT
jgi:hypothetical protein